MISRRWVVGGLVLLACGLMPRRGSGQAPTIGVMHAQEPGSMTSSLGSTPGAGASPFGNAPGAGAMVLSGRPGPSAPHLPSLLLNPPNMAPMGRGIAAPARLAVVRVPNYGPLELPDAAETEGTPDGLTLDAAIDRLIRENLDLRSKAINLPTARADILTASLRSNPIFYADGQLVPYGQYTRSKPGGQTQYDVNVSYPFDLSHKRQARTVVAEQTESILEAQFRDAVRLQIDNLYTAFIDVLAARETIRYAEASVKGLDRIVVITKTLFQKADATSVDVSRIQALREAARVGLIQDRETLQRTRRILATLLNVHPGSAESLNVRGVIADLAPEPPPVENLVRLALEARPDLVAHRLGLGRATSDVQLAQSNRFGDVYVLFQPYTFQNNLPTGEKSSTSYAVGASVPLPISNRNQGGIQRARLNVDQTQMELSARERLVASEVTQAHHEYTLTRSIVRQLERAGIPAARQMREDSLQLYTAGELDALDYYNTQRDYNELVRQYRDALVRHRRSMLVLNTAVGLHLLP